MQKLNSYIFTKVLKLVILPMVLAEIILVLVVATTAYDRFETNKALVLKRSTENFETLTMQIARNMEQRFENVMQDTNALKEMAEPIFSDEHLYKNFDLDFRFYEGFYFVDNLKTTSVYTTNISTLTQEDKNNLEKLYLIASPVDAVVKKHKKKIDYAWINIGAKYSLYYPKINLNDELSSDLNATEQSYYYEADAKHNPKKETIFIPLFNEPWALGLGQIGAVVSPIYVKEKMIGVVGVALTAENTKVLNRTELPFNAYVLMTNKEGYLLFSSNEKQSFKDFNISSFTGLYKEGKKEPLKMFVCSPDEDSDFLFHEHMLGHTGLNLVLVTRKSEIAKDVVGIFRQTQQAGFALLLFVILLHIFLYRYVKAKTHQMTQQISGPVTTVAEASNKLFYEEAFAFENSDIKELDTLHVNLEKAHEKLINQLYTDANTSLANQKKLLLDIQENDRLILIRIDNFKNINNIYGVQMGDKALKAFVFQLQEIYKNRAKIYRVDSDVFALLSSELEGLHEHYEEVKKIKILIDKVSIVLDFSLSFAQAKENSELSLYARAEIALEEVSKQDHLNFLAYDEKKHLNQYKENLKWAKKLQDAFDEERLVAYFQPIYDIKAQRVYKFESLVRMQDGDKVISPFFFLGAAARMGKLSEITRIMLKQVFEASVKYPEVEFSVNVSFEDFEQADLLPEIKALMSEYKIDKTKIIFELLETGTLADEKKIISTIKELKDLGCKIAIDDFGTGNSNFAHLMLMKVDYIKIDGQFIKNIHEDQQSLNITKTIKAFADLTGAKTIAEFVSEKEILEKITDLEIDYAQGYYLSEPRPFSDIEEMLKIQTRK